MSHRQFVAAVQAAHSQWGHRAECKHNALFTLAGTTPKGVLAQLPPPQNKIETVSTAPGVIFWSADKKNLSRSTMMKLAKTGLYKQMTVRNHNTVFKIRDLFENI